MPLPSNRGVDSACLKERFIPREEAFLLVKFTDDTRSFKHVSPYKIRDTLGQVLDSPPQKVSTLRSGALLIKTGSDRQVDTLLGWTSFMGKDIHVFPADRLNQKEGVVYAPELCEETAQTILDESISQGVTAVTRLPSKTSRPSPLLKLRFSTTELPTHFFAAYIRYEVRPSVTLPRRCGRCLRYGHGKGTCRSQTQRCSRCAGDHPVDGCSAPFLCAACKGPHAVTDKRCPVWVQKLEAERAKAEPRRANPSGGEWPPLPSPAPSHSTAAEQRPHPQRRASPSSTASRQPETRPTVPLPTAGGSSGPAQSQSILDTTQSASPLLRLHDPTPPSHSQSIIQDDVVPGSQSLGVPSRPEPLDSDDSTAHEASEDEITQFSPATPPTVRRSYNLRRRSSERDVRNVGYRTPLKRSFVPEDSN